MKVSVGKSVTVSGVRCQVSGLRSQVSGVSAVSGLSVKIFISQCEYVRYTEYFKRKLACPYAAERVEETIKPPIPILPLPMLPSVAALLASALLPVPPLLPPALPLPLPAQEEKVKRSFSVSYGVMCDV